MRWIERHPYISGSISLGLAGAVASLALPPNDDGAPILLICLLSWSVVLLLDASRWHVAFGIGWMTGFGWFLASLYWLGNALITGGEAFYWMIPFAVTLVPAGLAVFWGLAFLLTWCCFKHPVMRIMGLCVWLMVMEWLRGNILTGFPWQSPGMVFATGPLGLRLASSLGVYGCGVVALWLAVLPLTLLFLLPSGRGRLGNLGYGVLGLFGCAFLLMGTPFERPIETTAASGMWVRVVQPSIPQQEKWVRNLRHSHIDQHIALSVEESEPPTEVWVWSVDEWGVRDGWFETIWDGEVASSPELIIWGEVSYAGRLLDDLPALRPRLREATQNQAGLILGSLRRDEAGQHYNSAFLLNADGDVTAHYDKRFLVPWGEFVPFRKMFPFVDKLAPGGDFGRGTEATILPFTRANGKVVKIAPLICYEIIYPFNTRKISQDADVIVNITNDAWFGDSLGPQQHFAMARMRAAETGLPVIRVANTGISAVIHPDGGYYLESLRYGTKDWGDAILRGRVNTIYARWGETGFVVALLMSLAVGFIFRRPLGDKK